MNETSIYVGYELQNFLNTIAGLLDDDAPSVAQFLLYEGAMHFAHEVDLHATEHLLSIEAHAATGDWVTRIIRDHTRVVEGQPNF